MAFKKTLKDVNKDMLHMHSVYLDKSKKSVKNDKEEQKRKEKKHVLELKPSIKFMDMHLLSNTGLTWLDPRLGGYSPHRMCTRCLGR